MAREKSNTTTDHDTIRQWAEERGGEPARVQGTGRGNTDVGMIRLSFREYSNDKKLERITWEEFFEEFDKKRLALVYQETTAEGAKSNFNKLLSRKTAPRKKTVAVKKTGASGRLGAKRSVGRGTASKAAKRTAPKKTASKQSRGASKSARKR